MSLLVKRDSEEGEIFISGDKIEHGGLVLGKHRFDPFVSLLASRIGAALVRDAGIGEREGLGRVVVFDDLVSELYGNDASGNAARHFKLFT